MKLFPPGVDIERRSTGFAWQFGLDVPITEHLSFNFDAKQLRIETDVTAGFGQVPLGTLEMKPWLVGVGLGWTF